MSDVGPNGYPVSVDSIPFVGFPKIARYSRECIITEKIDGTNAQVFITSDSCVFAASRSRWLMPGQNDNFGFAAWVKEHEDELRGLGSGRHFGEWWGQGIQRRYGLTEKRFSLFNVTRWADDATPPRPPCCHVVPIIARGPFTTTLVEKAMRLLERCSYAAPGFDRPEGLVIYHTHGNVYFKKTFEKDDVGKEG